jgi:uncharacterized phage protein gp47/JayE
VLGRLTETDAAARLRREQLLRAQGNSTVEAVRADVLQVSGVTEAYVFENPTNTTDADGIPPKAIEVLVRGGAAADIRKAIWESKPAGIETAGSVSGTHIDTQGFSHTVKYSTPTQVNVYITVDVTSNAQFPADGAAQIKQALADWGDTNQLIGTDVVHSKLYGPVFEVSGIEDVTAIKIGTAPGPTGTANVVITNRQIADIDTSRIVVNVV